MSLITPVQYLRRRSARKRSAKPTCLAKITSREYINPQVGSPLFSLLPAEIRAIVFEHALLGYPDPKKPYLRHSYYYRPGYTHARRIATALLLSCRRVYLETSTLPIELNEHIIYAGEPSHAPPTYRPYLFPTTSLRAVQREAIRSVHLFAQQYWLEDWNERDQWHDFCKFWSKDLAHGPERLRVTLRHTDWWYYLLGSWSPLALDPRKAGRARTRESVTGADGRGSGSSRGFEEGSWGTRFSYFRGLRIFELELETLKGKRVELDEVVAIAPAWHFDLADRHVLVLDEDTIQKHEWTGSSRFSKAPDVEPGLPLRQGRRATLAGLRTGRQPSFMHRLESDAWGTGTLDYYVVLLTWRAQAPKEENNETIEEAQDAGHRQCSRDLDTSLATYGAAAMQNGGPGYPVNAALASGPARAAAKNVIPSYWG
ncbi:MAG: hypothetical protein Q9217_000146 [Psora testacea]